MVTITYVHNTDTISDICIKVLKAFKILLKSFLFRVAKVDTYRIRHHKFATKIAIKRHLMPNRVAKHKINHIRNLIT